VVESATEGPRKVTICVGTRRSVIGKIHVSTVSIEFAFNPIVISLLFNRAARMRQRRRRSESDTSDETAAVWISRIRVIGSYRAEFKRRSCSRQVVHEVFLEQKSSYVVVRDLAKTAQVYQHLEFSFQIVMPIEIVGQVRTATVVDPALL
jgi:hypothetical protein